MREGNAPRWGLRYISMQKNAWVSDYDGGDDTRSGKSSVSTTTSPRYRCSFPTAIGRATRTILWEAGVGFGQRGIFAAATCGWVFLTVPPEAREEGGGKSWTRGQGCGARSGVVGPHQKLGCSALSFAGQIGAESMFYSTHFAHGRTHSRDA